MRWKPQRFILAVGINSERYQRKLVMGSRRNYDDYSNDEENEILTTISTITMNEQTRVYKKNKRRQVQVLEVHIS